MNYRETRNYQNLEKRLYQTDNEWGFPELAPCALSLDSASMLGFNYAKTEKYPEDKIVHFFLDDYQFERVWNDPNRYMSVLQRFKAVVMPDFSVYIDFPRVIQQYNHYRNLWLSKYWQEYGIEVIPQISFGSSESMEWSFLGMPKDSLLCISTVGSVLYKESKKMFMFGLKNAMFELEPRELLVYGKLHDCVKEVLTAVGFTGKVTVGAPKNLVDREQKSQRGKIA